MEVKSNSRAGDLYLCRQLHSEVQSGAVLVRPGLHREPHGSAIRGRLGKAVSA